MSAPPYPLRLRRRLAAARLVLNIERWWPMTVAAASFAAFFIALALFGLPHALPGWVHAGFLVFYTAAAFWVLKRLFPNGRAPDFDAAARRLEQDNCLEHRPIRALNDQPISGSDGAVWAEHQRRQSLALQNLAIAPPQSDMAARDPWGLRAVALLALAAAAAGGLDHMGGRLTAALSPALHVPGPWPESVEFWIIPPEYTGKPAFAANQDNQPIPAGSLVRVLTLGGWAPLSLQAGGPAAPLLAAGNGRSAETVMTQGAEIKLTLWGYPIATRRVGLIVDSTPSAEFTSPPEPTERGRLHAAVAAGDDYGLDRVWIKVRRIAGPIDEAPLEIDIALPAGRPRQSDGSGWYDLTAHPWSGLPVIMQPMARDALGQIGSGETATLTLPERNFSNPAAALVVEQRRRVTESRKNAHAAASSLNNLTDDPAGLNDDLAAFLTLRLAAEMLIRRNFDLAEMQELLWYAALRLEDGDLAAAEQDLEKARRALEQAAQGDVSPQQLNRLLDAFQDALQRWLAAMTARMDPDQVPFQAQSADSVSDQDLMDMVQSLRDMAETGSKEGLRQMLRDLSNVLDSLQTGASPQPSAAASKAMRMLRDLIERQQALLDQSHKAGQEQTAPAFSAAADKQNALRQTLAEAAKQFSSGLDQVPDSLNEADSAMEQAVRNLAQGEWIAAEEAQGQALYALQQAARRALENMAAGGMAGALPRDPLGRPLGRGAIGDNSETRIPDQNDINKARQILEELRRREGELRRPEDEREYLQRLLRRF